MRNEHAAKVNGMGGYNIQQEKVKGFYDRQVLLYPDNPAILGVKPGLPVDCRDYYEWKEFNRLVALRENMHVLELGCGGGRWCEHFAVVVERVTGVDLSPNAIALARKNAESKRVRNIEYHISSIEDFQPQESYDLIYFSGVALYLDDVSLLESLAKYGAKLNKNGCMVVRDSVANESHFLCHNEGYSAQYRTIEEFERLFLSAGFTLEGNRRAFPGGCLSSILNLRYIQLLYRLSKIMSLGKLFISLLMNFIIQSGSVPHWRQNCYIYNHYLLLFVRNGNRLV